MLRGHRLLAAVLAAAAVVMLATVAYSYDSSRDDLISKGVSVGGVDVGGLRAAEARTKLRAQLARKLERPVRVAVAGRRLRLTARRARLVVDVDGMVEAAVERSREGWLPGRLWRGLTGAELDADLPTRVTRSSGAVKRFVRRVERIVNRPARNAELALSAASLPAVPAETGLKVQAGRLGRSIEAAINRHGAGRRVRGRVSVVQPDITTDELAGKYPYFLTVDRAAKKLRFFKDLKLTKTYPIAVGRIGFDTPAGLYHVQNKAVNPAWSAPEWAGEYAGKTIPGGAPDNPLKERWLGFFDGAGIHGTDSLGSLGTAASHGCIRMSIPEVIELYDAVPVQTPIYIE